MNKIFTLSLLGILTTLIGLVLVDSSPTVKQYKPREIQRFDYSANWHGAVKIQEFLHGTDYTAADVIKTLDNAERIASKRSSSLGINWRNIGPDNIGGRTRVFLQSKNNPDRLFAGAASGGLFVSNDNGNTWEPVNDLAPNNIISSGIVAEDGTIYIGTGTSFEGIDWPGKGIFKSTDDGETFQVIESTIPGNSSGNIDSNSVSVDWAAVNDIAIDPNNSNVIYAATNAGLRRSIDGGISWDNPLHIDFTGCSLKLTADAFDVKFTADNSRLIVAVSGQIYYSDDPANESCFFQLPSTVANKPFGARVELATAPSNPNVVYAITSVRENGGAFFGNVYKSTDKAETWNIIDPAPPINSINWTFCGANGQCVYDLAIGVYPDNEDHILIGGVQLWRFDGNWTRIANEQIDPFSDNWELYVHADKHSFAWDERNPNRAIITTDGGIHITEDRGNTFNTSNKNYRTTQFYGIHFSKDGAVVGGTQDNGVLLLNVEENGAPTTARTVSNQGITNGDGFDCEVSQIVDLKFTTAQFGALGRSPIESFTGSGICGDFCEAAPFWTTVKLWESDNDLTSKDSIEFAADTLNQAIGVGNASSRLYSGTLTPIQQSAEIIYSTLTFSAGEAIIDDADGDGIYSTADGEATVNTTTGTYQVTFNTAPTLNLPVFANYGTRYNAGDMVVIASETDNIPIEYTFTENLELGQSVNIQDPVQSLLAFPAGGSVQIARGAININRNVEWISLGQGLASGETRIPQGSGGSPLEFTNDGNHLFTASGRTLYRVSNLNDLYESSDRTKLTSRSIFTSPGGNITGVAIHPVDPEKIVVTTGGYGIEDHVFLIENAITAQSTSAAIHKSVMSATGSAPLPALPVYDAEFDVNNPSTVVLGTLYGIWATGDIFAAEPKWSNETATLARVPVYDIRQQKLPFNKASNYGVMYAGSFGRGIWRTDNFVSVPEFDAISFGSDFEANLKVYPNPMSTMGFVQFELPKSMQAQFSIFTLSGQQLVRRNRMFEAGENVMDFDASALSSGTYLATLKAGDKTFVTKFIKR